MTDRPAWRACPVCGEPDRPAAGQNVHCSRCQWQLASPLRLGKPPNADFRAFQADLAERQQQWDLDAAWRASIDEPAPEAAFGRLRSVVRGGPAEESALEPAPVPPAAEPTVTVVTMVEALRGTPAHRQLSFVEVGRTGLALWCATDGLPDLAVVWSRSWPQVCPWLSADEDVQRFQLAGGLGRGLRVVGPHEWDSFLQDALQQISARLVEPVLLVRPAPGWPLLDRAVAAARARFAPAAELPAILGHDALNRMAAEIMRSVPRPEGYDVLVARRDPRTGALVAARRELFSPAVLTPGSRRRATLEVFGSPAGAPALLPVVAQGSADLAAAAGVASIVVPLGPGERTVVEAYHEGPGRIRLEHPHATADRRPWEQFAPHLPELLRTDGTGLMVDLAVTVELGGDAGTVPDVRARIEAARRLVSGLAAAGTGLSLRVAVLGYGDHDFQQPWLYLGEPLGPPESALDRMASWGATRMAGDLVAPLEDALVEVARLDWRDGSRRLVVMFAGRPAHVPDGATSLRRCDSRHDVRAVAARLREQQHAELFPVVTPPRWATDTPEGREALAWAGRLWPDLSDAGPFTDADGCLAALQQRTRRSGLGERLRLALDGA